MFVRLFKFLLLLPSLSIIYMHLNVDESNHSSGGARSTLHGCSRKEANKTREGKEKKKLDATCVVQDATIEKKKERQFI